MQLFSKCDVLARCFLVLFLFLTIPAKADWEVIQSPSSETFNGNSSSPDGRFRVAVGNAGTIVHFTEDNPNGVVVASGTNNDLFDVFVVSPDFAAASGRDVVLMWDGNQWSSIVTRDGLYLPVWATPEKDVILYNKVDEVSTFPPKFNLRCGWDVAAGEDLPGCYAGPLDLFYCGDSEGLLVLNENGDFQGITSRFEPVNGVSSILHDDQTGLSLTAAFIPPGSCLSGGALPSSAFAINSFKQIWEWSGSSWSNSGVSIPNDQTLTWISGSGPNHVLAVGYKPSADINDPGNDAVAFQYDGHLWGPVLTDGPPDLPGFTDVDLISFQEQRIFYSSLEQNPTVCSDPDDFFCIPPDYIEQCVVTGNGFCDSAWSAGEDGKVVVSTTAAPAKNADLYLEAQILNYGNLSEIEQVPINYGLIVGNHGEDTAEGVALMIMADNLTVLNCPDFSLNSIGIFHTFTLNSSLPVSEIRVCEVTVLSTPSISEPVKWVGSIFAEAYSQLTDYNLKNNAISCSLADGKCRLTGSFAVIRESQQNEP